MMCSTGIGIRSIVLVTLLALLAGSVGGWGASRWTMLAPQPDILDEPCVRGKVVALGRLEPENGIISVGGPPGDRIAAVMVREGQIVEAGTEMIRLESYADRKAERDLIVQQQADAQNRYQAAEQAGQARIHELLVRQEQLEQVGQLDLATLDSRIALLTQQRESAARHRDRLMQLRADTLSAQERDQADLVVRQAEEELAAARLLREKTATAREHNLRMVRAQIDAARSTLLSTLVEIPRQALARSRALADLRCDRAIVKAPVKGRVLKLHAKPGETVGPTPLVQLGDTARMVAVVEVYETDVASLREWLTQGRLRVWLESKALRGVVPQGILHGSVTAREQIGSLIASNRVWAVDPIADVDRRVIEVRVALDHSELAAEFVNLQVNVSFQPDE